MNKDIFISYKAEEFHIADALRASIEALGVHCWMAPADIPGGSSYATEIPVAIRNCQIYVLVLSSLAQESKWIPRELDQAINDNKVIMPFMIENCPLKDDFRFYLTNVQRYAAYEDYDAALAKLHCDIKGILGIKDDANQVDVLEENEITACQTSDQKTQEFISQEKSQNITQSTQQNTPKDTQHKRQDFANKSKPKTKKPLLAIAGVAIGLIVILTLFTNSNTVVIDGKKYGISDSSLYLEAAELDSKEIAAIAKMKNLTTLSLTGCTILDENVGQMIGDEMWSLYLRDCNLTKEQIQSIDLSNSSISRLDLSGNANLETLDMIAPISSNLVYLNISNTSVSNISNIADCSDLTTLLANSCGISDITALRDCNKLEAVYLNGNELVSLDGLEHCIELREIYAAENNLTSIDGLTNATILQTVYLDYNNIEDVTILSKSASTIKYLYLRDNKLDDISFLAQFANLTYVALDDNQIQSLESLKNSSGLVGVSASGNKIQSTKGIEGKPTLTYVNLADNDIIDVGVESPLILTDSYNVVLDLSDNPFIEANISCDGRIKLLALSNCPIGDYEFIYDLKVNELILDYSELIDFNRLSNTDVYEYIIVGCPLDKQLSVKETLGTYSTNFVDAASEYYKILDYSDLGILGTKEYYHE